jgi:hypothetical protein
MTTGLEGLDLATYLGVSVVFLVIIAIWSLIWKGIALWKAGRKNQPIWFIVLLVINTLGILEILYIFWFSKMTGKKQEVPRSKKKRR